MLHCGKLADAFWDLGDETVDLLLQKIHNEVPELQHEVLSLFTQDKSSTCRYYRYCIFIAYVPEMFGMLLLCM